MNLGIGLGLTNYLRVPTVALDPDAAIAALFESGEEGAWYDPSDSTTVFQDAAGTTPAGVGDPVGLILDKSQGLTLGSEQVANGDFSSGTANWVVGGGVSIINAEAVCSAIPPAGNILQQAAMQPTTNSTVRVSFEITAYTSGDIRLYINNNSEIITISGVGVYSRLITATSTTGTGLLIRAWNSNFTGTIDNISVKELAGNHATQTTSAARPVLQSSGGLYYLDFDGVDDALTTAAVDLSGTNQLAVAAGFRDAVMTGARGTVFNQNLGGFNGVSMFAPSGVANNIQYAAFGDIGGGSMSLIETGLPNSLTAVLLANTDLSTTTNVLRRDGTGVATGGTAGAGNYTNTPLYFGHRGGSSFFNGNLCGCVVIDRTLTAGEISDLESYLAAKSGVTL